MRAIKYEVIHLITANPLGCVFIREGEWIVTTYNHDDGIELDGAEFLMFKFEYKLGLKIDIDKISPHE